MTTRPFTLALLGGLVAATLDIVYACAFWAIKADVSCVRILQSVAAGLLGDSSFRGGSETAALGLLLHYLIAFVMALVYCMAARRWALLRTHWLRAGAVYGLLLYALMQYAVVPLSRAASGPPDTFWVALSIAVHVVLVGIPIAFFARRVDKRPWPANA